MIFGVPISLQELMLTGLVSAVVLVVQVLVGKRVIRFKGRMHQKVHRWLAYVLVMLTVAHGVLAVVMVNQWRIGG